MSLMKTTTFMLLNTWLILRHRSYHHVDATRNQFCHLPRITLNDFKLLVKYLPLEIYLRLKLWTFKLMFFKCELLLGLSPSCKINSIALIILRTQGSLSVANTVRPPNFDWQLFTFSWIILNKPSLNSHIATFVVNEWGGSDLKIALSSYRSGAFKGQPTGFRKCAKLIPWIFILS